MGNQCSTTHRRQQFQTIKQYEHQSLGHLKLIHLVRTYNNQNYGNGNANNNGNSNINGSDGNMGMLTIGDTDGGYEMRDGEVIGVKQCTFGSQSEREEYLRAAKQAKSYMKIPTLLRLLSYQMGKSGKPSLQGQHTSSGIHSYRCGPSYTVNIYFTYYPRTLSQILTQKRHTLSTLLHKPHHPKNPFNPLLTKSLKLNNYQLIDKLPHNERKIINIYYQQVEILRFIDYIIGALYFLNHLEHRHEAVCPENIMVDQEGKFALPDAVVFRLAGNYEIGLAEAVGKSIGIGQETNRCGLKYLSPELLMNIKNKNATHHESSQKAQIFSVGLIALEMCLFDFNILESPTLQPLQHCPIPTPLLDRANLKLNKTFTNKALIQAQSRYSLQLVDLLTLMLEYDPVKRINFSTLIDMLSPLLMQNLTKIQKLYNPNPTTHHIPNPTISTYEQPQHNAPTNKYTNNPNQFMHKLSQLETNYQKILNRTIMFESSMMNEGNLVGVIDEKKIIEDQQRILRELKKINVNFGGKGARDVRQVGVGEFRDRREVKGSQLYDIYLSQYETIKKNRFR